MTPDVTDDLFFGGALRLLQPKRGHRFGGDAALLASAARSRLRPGARVADFGAGVGAVGLALAGRGAGNVTLVEIDPATASLAEENARRNELSKIVSVVVGDVAAIEIEPGSVDLVVTNPPFDDAARHRASPDFDKARAHVDHGGIVEAWIAAARRLLATGGSIVLIHRPEALPALLRALGDGFGEMRTLAVLPRTGAAPVRVLIAARKGADGPPVEKPALVMHGPDGRFTPEADAAQRGAAILDLS